MLMFRISATLTRKPMFYHLIALEQGADEAVVAGTWPAAMYMLVVDRCTSSSAVLWKLVSDALDCASNREARAAQASDARMDTVHVIHRTRETPAHTATNGGNGPRIGGTIGPGPIGNGRGGIGCPRMYGGGPLLGTPAGSGGWSSNDSGKASSCFCMVST